MERTQSIIVRHASVLNTIEKSVLLTSEGHIHNNKLYKVASVIEYPV
jgi:hypothetical protein